MSVARFLGGGVRASGDAVPVTLEHAVHDVTALVALLGGAFASEILRDPDEETIRRHLRVLPESISDGPLVVLWCGHAIGSAADSLRLLASDSASRPSAGIGISDVVAPCAESGANQLLFLVDTCFSGAAVAAADVAAKILQGRPPGGKYIWAGVLASCLDVETARDGLFGQRLRELLANGPQTPELKVRWSPHSRYVRGDDVCDAVLKEWDSDVQRPDFSSRGSAWWVFPNPLYDAGAPEQVVEHLLQAARGGAGLHERSWFTGRTTEVNQVVNWVRSGQPGIYVITGSAGTGKSAIGGRVVSLSNPAERERLLADGSRWEHQDPGEGSVRAHWHARGLTTDRAAAVLADQLVAAGVLGPQAEPRNASELVGQLQRMGEQGQPPPVIVVDLGGEDGLTGGVIRALLNARQPVVVIGTLWPDRYAAYTALPVPGGADPHARELELLDLAAVLRIAPEFSPAEHDRARAAAGRDPRLRIALESAGYGLTQTLAAAPQLVGRWEDAQASSPYAWAVLTAALDATRLGARAPLSADFLPPHRAAAPASSGPRRPRTGSSRLWLTPTQNCTAPPLRSARPQRAWARSTATSLRTTWSSTSAGNAAPPACPPPPGTVSCAMYVTPPMPHGWRRVPETACCTATPSRSTVVPPTPAMVVPA